MFAIFGKSGDGDVQAKLVYHLFYGCLLYTSKVAETAMALMEGADEIDIVISVGKFRAGDYEGMCEEIQELKATCKAVSYTHLPKMANIALPSYCMATLPRPSD